MELEQRIVEVLGSTGTPCAPSDLFAAMKSVDERSLRSAVSALVDRGDVSVTGDWKLRLREPRQTPR